MHCLDEQAAEGPTDMLLDSTISSCCLTNPEGSIPLGLVESDGHVFTGEFVPHGETFQGAALSTVLTGLWSVVLFRFLHDPLGVGADQFCYLLHFTPDVTVASRVARVVARF